MFYSIKIVTGYLFLTWHETCCIKRIRALNATIQGAYIILRTTQSPSRLTIRFLYGAILFFVLLAPPVYSQGFMVNPMRIDVSGRPGQTLRVPLELINTTGSRNQILQVIPTHLGQTPAARWGVSSDAPTTSSGDAVSARDWLEIPIDTVDINPLERKVVDLLIQIPFDARGTYVAGLLVESPPTPGQTGISVQISYFIPVIVDIEGRPARQQVSVSGVTMNYVEDGDDPTTILTLNIDNEGRTFPRIQGTVHVEYLMDGRWRSVTRVDYRELGIVPGVSLSLEQDLERRLPSGEYRLRADLQVEGRRTAPFVVEIAFKGDDRTDLLALDQTLQLNPPLVRFDVAPGATRTNVVTITNPSEETILVDASVHTPPTLQGIMMGDTTGEMLSSASWMEIRPASFRLPPNGRQSIRVVSLIPRDGVDRGNYYATVKLVSRYTDGQSAGEMTSVAHLVNSAVDMDAGGMVERVALTQLDEGDTYSISSRFVNIGNVHLVPRLSAAILDRLGHPVLEVDLSGNDGFLLPMGTRNFGSEMDLSGLDEGIYALQVSAVFGDENKTVRRQQLIEIEKNSDGFQRIQVLEENPDPGSTVPSGD